MFLICIIFRWADRRPNDTAHNFDCSQPTSEFSTRHAVQPPSQPSSQQSASPRFTIVTMSEATVSQRSHKKQTRDAGQRAPRSESVASEAAKKDDPSTTMVQAAIDSGFRPRDGANPFVDVVQKKVRNLTKRRVRSPPFIGRIVLMGTFRLVLRRLRHRRMILVCLLSNLIRSRRFLFFLR
jgi:hypothetical protein